MATKQDSGVRSRSLESELVALRQHSGGVGGRQQSQFVEGESERRMGNGERGYRVKRNIPIRQTLSDLAIEVTISKLFRSRKQLIPGGISNFQSFIGQEALRICSCCMTNNDSFQLRSILSQNMEIAKVQRVLGLASYHSFTSSCPTPQQIVPFQKHLLLASIAILNSAPFVSMVKNIHAAPSIWRLCPSSRG